MSTNVLEELATFIFFHNGGSSRFIQNAATKLQKLHSVTAQMTITLIINSVIIYTYLPINIFHSIPLTITGCPRLA
jgi:hypothetical protein